MVANGIVLTHCGQVMPYNNTDIGQHCFRYWFGAWQHQAITWTNVYLSSVVLCGIHLRAISKEVPSNLYYKVHQIP